MTTKTKKATKRTTKTAKRSPLVKRAAAPAKREKATERRITPNKVSAASREPDGVGPDGAGYTMTPKQKREHAALVASIAATPAKTKTPAQRCATCKGGTVPSTYAGYRHCVNAKCVDCSRDVDASGTPRPVDALTLEELPPVLQTGQGRRWAGKVLATGWTVATMPARDFALMASAISRRAVETLLGVSWTSIAKARGFDPNAKKTRAPSAGRVGLGLGADEVASVTRARGERAPRVAADAPLRALVDDVHLCVPVSTLPVGSTFKTADDVRIGVRGWQGTVARHGIGSTSITGGRWDYIAPGAAVVPLVIAEPSSEVSA